jgi:hypothetical protein
MRLGKKIVVLSLLLWFVLGVGVPAGLAQSAGGPRLAVQLDGLFYYRGESASFSSTAFSPVLAFEAEPQNRAQPSLGRSTGSTGICDEHRLAYLAGERAGLS